MIIKRFFEDNKIGGTIPSSIGNLVELRNLFVKIKSLKKIWLHTDNTKLIYRYGYNNELTGPIPQEIGNLENLEIMYIINVFL